MAPRDSSEVLENLGTGYFLEFLILGQIPAFTSDIILRAPTVYLCLLKFNCLQKMSVHY